MLAAGWGTLVDIATGIVALAGVFVARSLLNLRERVSRLEGLDEQRQRQVSVEKRPRRPSG